MALKWPKLDSYLKWGRVSESRTFGVVVEFRSLFHSFEVGKNSDVFRHFQIQMDGRIKST